MPHLVVTHLPRTVAERQKTLGFEVLMDHGWIVTLGNDQGYQFSLVTADDWSRSAELVADLSDPGVMDGAWR